MIKCPVCKKKISELDERCPYCHINLDDITEDVEESKRITSADCLNVMANINIILSIIGAILIWVNFGTTEITHKGTYFSSGYTENVANWYGIFGGIVILIAGFTLFFLLKTIVDIYWEVER